MLVLLERVLPHHVEHCGADEAVLDGAWKEERRRIGQQCSHDVTPKALGDGLTLVMVMVQMVVQGHQLIC